MKLSVLITTYNLEKYIDQALESVFSQKTDYDYEVIVGDDGSTDDTIVHLKKWKEKYPNILSFYIMSREKNVKYNPIIRASKNRLSILKHARGEYVTFLDGDDFYSDCNKYQKQIDILDANRECSVCLHNYNNYYENEKRIIKGSNMDHYGVIDSNFYWQNCYVHAATGIYRNIFSDEWFGKWGDKPFDDNLIIFNQMIYGKIYFIADIMLNYRQNPTPWKEKTDLEKAFFNLIDYDLEIEINPKFRKSSLCRHYRDFLKVKVNRDEISEYAGTEYEVYALTMGGHTALRYMHWNSLKKTKKIYFTMHFIFISLMFCISKIVGKLKEKYWGVYKNKC